MLNHPLYLGSCALLLSCDHVFWNDPSVLPDCGKRRIRGGIEKEKGIVTSKLIYTGVYDAYR